MPGKSDMEDDEAAPKRRDRRTGNPMGRPPGSHNKFSNDIRKKAQESGALPHELLLQWARGEPMVRKVKKVDDDRIVWETEYVEVDPETMRDSAKAAAPYYAPKISTVEVISGVSDADLDEFITRSAAEAGISLGHGGEGPEGTSPPAPAGTSRRVRL